MANTVLIAGASGLVSAAIVNKFLDDGSEVIAVSRRQPEIFSDKPFQHLPVNLQDEAAVSHALSGLSQVTHVIYAAVYEKPGLNRRLDRTGPYGHQPSDAAQPRRALCRDRGTQAPHADAGHQGLRDPLHPMPVPARERFPRDDHPNFYWLQEDYIKEKAAAKTFDFTIMRPQTIVGPNTGVVMNLPPVIGAYAAICKEEGRPFGLPGGAPYVWEAVDCRLVAGAIRWAAEAPAAAGQHFNLTNGEVFAWRDLWPAFAKELGVELGPDEPVSMGEFLPPKADVWDKIVAKHGLRRNSTTDLLGESHYYADFCFAYGAEEPPRGGVREHGKDQAGRVHRNRGHRAVLPALAARPHRASRALPGEVSSAR